MTDERKLTGKHVLIIFVTAFGIIIGVNIALAVSAVRTFPGLEAKNSYVASQQFDRRRDAQLALGWEVAAEARDGRVFLSFKDADGGAVEVAALEATVGRATHVRDDISPDFRFNGQDYVADAVLGDGNWNIRLKARAQDGTEFTQRVILHVRG